MKKKAQTRKKLVAEIRRKDHLLRKARLVSLLLASFNLFLLSVLFTTYYNVLPIRAQVYSTPSVQQQTQP